MKRLAGYAAFLITLGALCVLAFSAGQARAAQAHAPVNWTARTCAAAQAYQRHPSQAGLETLVADSMRAPWKYLGGDVWQMVEDVHAHPKYVSADEQWIRQDCHS